MMNRYISFILFFLCFSCIWNNNTIAQNTTLKNDILHVIDLDILQDTETINISSVFNKVETIILETKKEALVYPIFVFFAFDDYIFILNQIQSQDFLVFDRNGKFIRKIGGPGEYRVYDFTIDTDNRIIYLLCNSAINKYSIDGTYTGSIRLEKTPNRIQYANGKLYADLQDGEYLLQEIDMETGIQKGKYLDLNIYNKGWYEQDFMWQRTPFKYRSCESPKFVHTFMDTIVAIHQDGLMPFLALKSKNLTTKTDIKATEGKKPSERILEMKTKNKIFGIFNYFETKNHIHFCYSQGTTHIHPILYCKSTNLYQETFLQNDLVFDINKFSEYFIFSDSNGVYESYYGNSLIHELFLKDIKEGKLAPHLDKREELMKITEDSNPVIFYYSYD